MSDLLKHQLRFLVIPTRFFPPQFRPEMEKAYQCWKNVWGQALAEEMNVKDELYSDNFSRQSHVAVLFFNDEPFALTTLNFMDLNDPVSLDDSYFKIWPKKVLDNLKSESSRIMTCCNVTLNFKYRNNALGIPGKDLMLAMLVQYLKHSTLNSIVAAVRLEKGMEKAAYRTAALSLERDLAYTIPGQRVDLVCWHRNLDLKLIDPEILEISKYIWRNSSNIVEREFIQGDKNAA